MASSAVPGSEGVSDLEADEGADQEALDQGGGDEEEEDGEDEELHDDFFWFCFLLIRKKKDSFRF